MEWTYGTPADADPGDREEAAALSANIRALNVVIGLLARQYPAHLAPQYIRECVQLKQYAELNRNEEDALSYMSRVYGADLFFQLVNLFEELEAKEDAAAESQRNRAGAAKTQQTPAKKMSVKKAPAKKTPAKKTGGAADGK